MRSQARELPESAGPGEASWLAISRRGEAMFLPPGREVVEDGDARAPAERAVPEGTVEHPPRSINALNRPEHW